MKPSDDAGQRRHRALAHVLRRAAVARQVERVGSGLLRHGLLVEEPVVEVAAVAVEEDHRVARGVPDLQEAQATAVDLDVLGLGALRRRHRGELLLEPLLEVGDVGVDPGVRDRVVGDDAQERPHGHGLARPHQRPAQLAGGRALEDVRDLRGLDVHDLLALGDHRHPAPRARPRPCPPASPSPTWA
jgi:hypothetical protein